MKEREKENERGGDFQAGEIAGEIALVWAEDGRGGRYGKGH